METKGEACSLRDVGYTYPANRSIALKGITLAVREGQWIALLGANGSGKSTFAKLLNALLLPTQGDCFVFGMDTKRPEFLWEIRKNVAMVFQNPDNQIVASVVEEDVAFGPENIGLPREEIIERVRWALSVTGLEEKRKSPTYALSGGQKQRLALAGALAMKPRCLVLDEPTSMLDPEGRRRFISLLSELHDQGLTLVLITHRLDEILDADRVVVLNEGHVVWQGEPLRLLSDERTLQEWGLEVPPLIQLRNELAKKGWISREVPIKPLNLVRELCRFESNI